MDKMVSDDIGELDGGFIARSIWIIKDQIK